ncbi:unnamed protein product [Gongylonema pulchrum]|uniref:Uncharacterized protein n=1 Tax=Gongylonema pulchrum TaxID=637853 RepID=A0A183D9Y2_9BILA|nr:unnamed protein product [Gongylonema pulchrum]VDN25013.1 unnamed protein product [Gongylonema pulchrum]
MKKLLKKHTKQREKEVVSDFSTNALFVLQFAQVTVGKGYWGVLREETCMRDWNKAYRPELRMGGRDRGGGVNRSAAKDAEGKQISWGIGELEWEAWMRVLDNAGYRTGHLYRQPLLRSRTLPASTSSYSDVAVPPSASSIGTVRLAVFLLHLF